MFNRDDRWKFSDHRWVVNGCNVHREGLTPRVACRVGHRDTDDRLTAGLGKQAQADITLGQIDGNHRFIGVRERDCKVVNGCSIVAAAAQEGQNQSAVVLGQELISHPFAGRVFVPLDGVASGHIDVTHLQSRVAG